MATTADILGDDSRSEGGSGSGSGGMEGDGIAMCVRVLIGK